MSALLRLRRAGRASASAAYCELDRFEFDPRYTLGRCPICGWAPEGAPTYPRWIRLALRIDWELLGLFLLADVLIVLGLIVARAAGLLR
jgi:hypothetical protein